MLTRKRCLALSVTVAAIVLCLLILQAVRDRLGDTSTFTGWTLLTSTAGLYLLSLRKKLGNHSVGAVSIWLQFHVYLGVFASVMFLAHIGWPVRGWFESLLAAGFVVVAASGVLLGILSRTTPRKLAAIAVDYRLESIPEHRTQVAESAHRVALGSSELGEGATLTEYYQRRLLPYFRGSRSPVYHLYPTGVRRRRLLRELEDLDRYLATAGMAKRRELSAMVCSKDDLDYHYAMQFRLRSLFTFHVSLTWALALMIAVHVVLVYRFQGTML